MICSGTFPVSGFLLILTGEQKMKKKRMVLVMAVSAMCMMAGCGNTVKDGTEALEQGDYDTAIASFEEAAGSDDKEEAAEGYCGLGMTYYEQKQYDQALEMLEKAFDNGTVKTAELCNLAGTSALCKEDYAKALAYIQEGIALAEEKQGNEKQEDKKQETLLQEMKYNEIICLEKTADWEMAKEKMSEYQAAYPEDDSVAKEAEFLQTR